MTGKDYQRYIQGKINKAQGAYFEQQIEASCTHYKLTGEAFIEKNNEPFVVTKTLGGGKFVGHYKGEAQTDYTGVLKGGRAICFEAKHTETDRMLQDMVKLHQAEDLDHKEEMGALCFVLCSIKERVYMVPWREFKAMKENFGHKYMTQEEAEIFRVKFKNGVFLFLESVL